MKRQFSDTFDELDHLIIKKYSELEECARYKAHKEAELERSRNILKWIEICELEIDELLGI